MNLANKLKFVFNQELLKFALLALIEKIDRCFYREIAYKLFKKLKLIIATHTGQFHTRCAS